MLNEKVFEAYQTYEWGVDPKVLEPIDQAIVAAHGDADARRELETKIAAVLGSEAPRAAKDYACRQLRKIGSGASVPALEELLTDDELSHMSRYALESIPAPEAGEALRKALGKTEGELKVGLISSLGVRAEDQSVAPLKSQLDDADKAVANAAAYALGVIGSKDAFRALVTGGNADKPVVHDASLRCAEKLLDSGDKAAAETVYKIIIKSKPSELVKNASEAGLKE